MIFLYNICYKIYFHLKRMKRSEKTGVFHKFYVKLCDTYSYYFWVLLNRKYPAYFEKHPIKYGLNKKPRDEEYIVSLTTFPKRIKYVHLAIETIMRGKVKPDKIILWLAESQFPDKKLPDNLTRLVEKGLTIEYCDDLRSHKKYYYAFERYSNSNIILVDDDLFYPFDLLKQLIIFHKKHPKNICSMSSQIIHPTITTLPTEWVVAKNNYDYSSSDYVQPFTGFGTLYPANWFTNDLLDKDKIMSIAPTADDLWLKAHSLARGVKTTKINKFRAFYIEIDNPENEMLCSVNTDVGDNLNNVTWQKLIELYNFK